ncbi:hypothetical protein KXW10_000382 [Aspergillus fumigatus]|nr:hypothetical protein KXW10_000382 [Aspergillus fumigatus]
MNTQSLIIVILYASVAQSVSFDPDYTPDPHAVNGIIAWTEPNCQGIAASTIFNGSTLAKNISNVCLARSFQLLRPLRNQEQLDISITQEPNLCVKRVGSVYKLGLPLNPANYHTVSLLSAQLHVQFNLFNNLLAIVFTISERHDRDLCR